MIQLRRVLLTGSAFVVSGANAASVAWHISERSGAVTVLHAGVNKAALGGAEIFPGDIVSTGANGRAVLVHGEDYLVVAPGAKLHVTQPVAANPLLQVFQESGNVIYKIKHLVTPHFSVQTPFLAAVVKGTTFSITVSDSGAAVKVIQGALEVKTNVGNTSEMVTTGMTALVKSGDLLHLKLGGDVTKPSPVPNGAAKPAAPLTSAAPGKTETSAASAPAQVAAEAAPVAAAPAPQAEPSEGVITTKIGEPAVSMAALTGGMIEGNSAFASDMANMNKATSVVTVAIADANAAAAAPPAPAVTPVATPAPVTKPTTVTVTTPDATVTVTQAPTPTPTPVTTPAPVVATVDPAPIVTTPAPAAPATTDEPVKTPTVKYDDDDKKYKNSTKYSKNYSTQTAIESKATEQAEYTKRKP